VNPAGRCKDGAPFLELLLETSTPGILLGLKSLPGPVSVFKDVTDLVWKPWLGILIGSRPAAQPWVWQQVYVCMYVLCSMYVLLRVVLYASVERHLLLLWACGPGALLQRHLRSSLPKQVAAHSNLIWQYCLL
jgi:hypothetical protein